ncbi:ABC transporter ATP-binding protein [Pseudonocardia sp. MH-G8]|uniref:ABC transporter ATP-binding protein n=1 Tax=Pseudonocardia sp. MH-G8 TaxID=1854588 RepID=UPI001E3C4A2F|nr:ABC transporter ATP-binding protein [Pseudonocardia sp. MH-G8]
MPHDERPAHLLEVDGLSVEFQTRDGTVRVVDDVSFALREGETLAVLGESGSGKSVTSLAVLGLLPRPAGRIVSGSVRFRGTDLTALDERQLRELRGERLAMVFQDPQSALNPVMTVGDQIGEAARRRRRLSRRAARAKAIDMMRLVRIPDAERRVDDYPHQFSGGMRQRAVIAMALALDPDLVIADEPTTALDVTVQQQIMSLLRELQQSRGVGLVLISHDLGVVAGAADRVVVMYGGRVIESGPLRPVYDRPAHPYTVGLMRSVPEAEGDAPLVPIPGAPPSPADLPTGCAFHPRCPLAADRCRTEIPPLQPVGPDRLSACHYAEEVQRDGVPVQPAG